MYSFHLAVKASNNEGYFDDDIIPSELLTFGNSQSGPSIDTVSDSISICDVEKVFHSSHSIAPHTVTSDSIQQPQNYEVAPNIMANDEGISKSIVPQKVTNSIQQSLGQERTPDRTYYPSQSVAPYNVQQSQCNEFTANIFDDSGKTYYSLQNVSSKPSLMNNIQQSEYELSSNVRQVNSNHSSQNVAPHTATNDSIQNPQNYQFTSHHTYQSSQSFVPHTVTNSTPQPEYTNRRPAHSHPFYYPYHNYAQPVSQPYYFQNQSYVQPQFQNVPYPFQTSGHEGYLNNYTDSSSVQQNYYYR